MFFLFFVLPFVPAISSIIVIWYCRKSGNFLAEKLKAKRFNQIGVFLLLMGGVSFIFLVYLSPSSYLFYLTFMYLIVIVEGIVLLIAGCISIFIGIKNR